MLKKILVLSIPRLEPHRPPISSTIVATVCKNLGHNVVLRDLNIEFYHFCKSNNVDYHRFDPVWDKFIEPTQQDLDYIDENIKNFCLSEDFKIYDYVMLSVFGMSNHFFAERLLRAIAPNRTFKIFRYMFCSFRRCLFDI